MSVATNAGAAAPQPEPKPVKGLGKLLSNNTYTILVLVLTIYSLIIMAIQMLMSENSPAYDLVNWYNNAICIFFLFDFGLHMYYTPRKRDYFIGERGYFDLLGSIPSLGFSQYTAILRLFRLSRLTRLRRIMNPQNRELLRKEILENRGSYALFITVLMALIVITGASMSVFYFESMSPNANIQSGGDAVWWATVTITTVGYGDRFPVTAGGRITGVFVMLAGVGVIGALASILASILVPQPKEEKVPGTLTAEQQLSMVRKELSDTRHELSALRQLLEGKDKT